MSHLENTLPALLPNDVVDVVAPASACSTEQLAAGLDVLRRWGLEPRVPHDLFGEPYVFANDDATRWRHLRTALRSRSSRAVWCVRGGYGSGRLLPYLARARQPDQHKLFIGFSDVTALHTFFVQAWGWPTLHGPVLSQMGAGQVQSDALEELRAVLFAEVLQLSWNNLRPMNEAAVATERIVAPLSGGNLKTLQSQLGTPWALAAGGTILVVEDVNERGYSIDRMLVQFAQSGALKRVRAIVFGAFTGGAEANGQSLVSQVIGRFARGFARPVFSDMAFGHVANARVVPLGMTAELSGGERGKLSMKWESDRRAPK